MSINQNEFDGLVTNALDFLKKSVTDLEAAETKYSAINFYSGLELLLKARLLQEHWCLCAADVGKMESKKFDSGDFESIGLREALNRLANIVGSPIDAQEESVYDRLRKRRNRAVHFYHPDDLDSEKKVAVEQLAAWHFLYRRLSGPWREFFEPFLPELDRLNSVLAKRVEYYSSIYSELKNDIEAQSKKRLMATCEICDQPSAFTKGEVVKGVHRLDCAVCNSESFGVFMPCRKCGKLASRKFEHPTNCQWCGNSHIATVEESFLWAERVHPGIIKRAWCGDCGYTVKESAVELGSSSLCLACHAFYEHSDMGGCGYCGSLVTGSVGGHSSPGCVRDEYSMNYEERDIPAPVYLRDFAERRQHRSWKASNGRN